MGASPTTGSRSTSTGTYTNGRTGTQDRLGTETKAAPKTTEFMLVVAVIIGILVSAMLIKGGDTGAGNGGTDEFIARQAWLYVAIVTAGYAIARGLAKSGSREPYYRDGTNSERDLG
jgi:hypothetical protein